jgi:hypothetical protein
MDENLHEYSAEQEIHDVSMNAPHLVILGAGASRAAFPDGINGYRIPLMKDLIQCVGLEDILKKHGVKVTDQNFEALYSSLAEGPNDIALLELINEKLINYFQRLALPEGPTIYDYLLLCLRKKDVIATFNWDPFLFDACLRNHKYAELPHVLYLHGNVRIGYCLKDMSKGLVGTRSLKSGDFFIPSKLLYPVKKKGYADDPFIKGEWDDFKRALSHAYILTIFGYGAPSMDVEAIDIMKTAWGPSTKREMEEIEIVDIKPENEMVDTWADLIHSHHYRAIPQFYDSWMVKHPRRTCDAMWAQLMDAKFIEENPIPTDLTPSAVPLLS